MLGVTLPEPGSLLGPGLVVGVNLSGVVGGTRPWMVLETSAETVTRFGDTEELWAFTEEQVELSELMELVAVSRGFAPFMDTPEPGADGLETPGLIAPFAVIPAAVAAEGEDGLGDSAVPDLEAPGWTGGRGARYLTLAGWDGGEAGCATGDHGAVAGAPDGIGGAGDLTDLGLGVKGFGCRGPEGSWGWVGSSAGECCCVWSTGCLLSVRMVHS